MKRSLLLAATVLAAGCSSTPPMPPVFSESLITNITAQGNQVFTYKATLNLSEGGGRGQRGGMGRGPGGGMGGGKGGGPGGGMGGGPGGGMGGEPGGAMGGKPGGGMQAKMRGNPEEAATERLTEVLADTGYCTNGWFVIEKTIDQGLAEIRGECRTASADDQ
ncbi:hypothetical protein [Microbulbifer hainanensis]|uniref:hypothetical protein n=1 Tax=Microbulbifer hainanensis TaxID=2735675 RepID=UPI00186669C7|nr:hypothetical protein [Microbulbifer hainanensis]